MMIRTLLLAVTVPLAFVAAEAQQSGWTPAPPAAAAPPAPAAPATPPVARAPRAATPAFSQGFAQTWDAMPSRAFNAHYPQDPADSLYKEARSLLNRGEWRRAATLFGQVAARTPASAYAADALYWQAFSLYRIGGMTELREALAALDARKSRFPRAGNADDAESLTTRVTGALASRGDATATRRLQSTAAAGSASCDSEELSVRASALSTLMRNDPAAATPILAKVLDRRDECSVSLRKSAVQIIGRKDDAASRSKLMDVAKNDPDASIRGDAIGYLAEANTDDVATALDGIVRTEQTESVQRSAVRALGGMTAPKAKAAIRALIERSSASERLRIDAIGTFDRRAGIASGFNYSFSCDGGQCVDRSGQFGPAVIAPTPPVPAVAAVRPVPAPSPAPRPAVAVDEARAAAAEARAASMADARLSTARAGQTAPMAISLGGDGFYSLRDDDRRISAEDAAWLRGVYPRLETNRLKSAAVSVLARSGDEPTTTWLANMLQREEEPAEVRSSILSRLGRDLPVAQLARLYDGASSRTVRTEIVQVLGRRDEPEATDKLIEIVRNGTDPQLRRSAISALNNKKDPRTTQLLLELIDK